MEEGFCCDGEVPEAGYENLFSFRRTMETRDLKRLLMWLRIRKDGERENSWHRVLVNFPEASSRTMKLKSPYRGVSSYLESMLPCG